MEKKGVEVEEEGQGGRVGHEASGMGQGKRLSEVGRIPGKAMGSILPWHHP